VALRGEVMTRIIIFANGDIPALDKVRALIRDTDTILCADGGTRHALAMGLTPNIIVGDMDSLPNEFQTSSFDGEIVLFPKDKNETDLELALDLALTLDPDEITIIGALGGRIDQTLANIALISNLQSFDKLKTTPSNFNLKLNDGVEELFFCKDRSEVKGRAGDIISLIPWQGEVTGITTSNLKWPLHDETLYPDKSRGISNKMTANVATIQIKSGSLLIVHTQIIGKNE